MQTKSALNGKTINLTADNTLIKSTNFNVDKDGNIICKNGTFSGTINSSAIDNTNFQVTSNGLVTFVSNPISTVQAETPLITIKSNNNYHIKHFLSYNGYIIGDYWEKGTPYSKVTMSDGLYESETMVASPQNSSYGARIYSTAGAQGTSAGANLILEAGYSGESTSTAITNSGIRTPTLTQTSLSTEKKNFSKYKEKALDVIKGIDIYNYNLKFEDDKDKKHIGFVIGDNYNYSNEVTNLENNGVDLYSFISLCCKAIQEQQEEIEALKKGE